MYKRVAPMLKPSVVIITPIHLPKINPAIKATGEPKPAINTKKIVASKNMHESKIKLDCFKLIKYSLLLLMNS